MFSELSETSSNIKQQQQGYTNGSILEKTKQNKKYSIYNKLFLFYFLEQYYRTSKFEQYIWMLY